MSIETILQNTAKITASVGRAALHTMLPDEFEFYSCTLELFDSNVGILGSLVFPVMPNNMSETNTPSVNIKKTAGGIVSLTNNNFTPSTITLSGTFGRKFRLLIQSDTNLQNNALSLKNADNLLKKKPSIPGFDVAFKNGYGTLKLMEKIIIESSKLDVNGNPRLLFFYNQALNHNHLVEVTSFTFNQSLESNVMWNYTLEMKTLALAENIILTDMSQDKKKKLKSLLSIAVINAGINTIVTNISAVNLVNGVKRVTKKDNATVNSIKAGGKNINDTINSGRAQSGGGTRGI